jgi:hypothetical protein
VQHGGGNAAPDPAARIRSKDNPNGFSPNLMTVVSLLKTPTAQLAVNGGSQHPDKRRAGGHGPTLADQVEHLLPTPTAMDSRGARNRTSGRKPDSAHHDGMTPLDVFWTGESTPSPSDGTSASSAAPLPGQLSLDELESG